MNKVFGLGLILGLAVVSACVAQEQKAAVPTSETAVAAQDQFVEVNNKICPVSHEEVGKEGMQPHKVTYNGKIYNLCCGMCEKDFNKDPQKYTKIMEEEAANASKIQ